MKKTLTLFLLSLLLSTISLKAQIDPITPGGYLDSVCDNLGNRYSLNDIDANRPIPGGTAPTGSLIACGTGGYFDLYFEPGSGMEIVGNPTHAARRAVICQAYADVANFIGSPLTGTNTVRIQIRDITTIASGAVLGVGGWYCTLPYGSTVGGILDGEIWKTINSGVDSYKGVVSPIASGVYYHGSLAINFGAGLNWNTSLTTGPSAGQLDLYTIALHEIIHSLGFGSLLTWTGTSTVGTTLPYFSRYDTHLYTSGGSPQPLVTNTGTCSMYAYGFNTVLTASSTISPGSGSCVAIPSGVVSDNSDCTNGKIINYVGSITQKVYTPGCYEKGSSLSHFEDQCQVPATFTVTPSNNQYFVMANAAVNGLAKRFPKPEERAALCDLGYSVGTSFGTSGNLQHPQTYTGTCSPNTCVGLNDGITSTGFYSYTTTPGGTVSISPLTNDYNYTKFECLEIVYGTGAVSTTTGTGAFTYTATNAGLHLLRYVPANTTSKGNITYIFVWVGSTNCTSSACNIVNNGTFESATGCGDFTGVTGPPLPNVNCWTYVMGSPDGFTRTCPISSYTIPVKPIPSMTIDTWSGPSTGNDKMIYCASTKSGICEAALGTLSSNLMPGQVYKLGFWALFQYPTVCTNTYVVQVATATNVVANIPGPVAALPSVFNSIGTFTLSGNATWNYITKTFTYTGTNPASHVMLINPSYANTTNTCVSVNPGVFFDDISIQDYSVAVTFTLPTNMCAGGTFTNLSTYCNIPGVFSGPGVTYSGGLYSFTSSTLGINTIVHTYTNASGCVIKTPAQINVISNPTISVTPTTATICPLTSTTLTASGSNYFTWLPSPLTGTQIAVSPSVTTIYTVSPGIGCAAVAYSSITVLSLPSLMVMQNPPGGLCPGYSTATVTASGATSYTFTDGTNTYTTNPVSLSPSSTTNYTVFGASGGCNYPYLFTINVNTTCICTGTSGTLPTSLSSTVVPAGSYAINSNLTIYGAVNFSNVELMIAPGVSITVANSATLSIGNSHLYSCFDMWSGITVNSTGHVAISNGALIEDANVAILSSASTLSATTDDIINITDCVFNRNKTAIKVTDYTYSITPYPFTIRQCIFTSRQFTFTPTSWPTRTTLSATTTPPNPLGTPYYLQNFAVAGMKAPNTGSTSIFGIKLDKVGATSNATATPTYYCFQVGDYLNTSFLNVFDNHFYGIAATDANLKCYQSIFQNTQSAGGGHAGYVGGMGIMHNTSTITPNTYLLLKAPAPYTQRKNKFYDCTYAVNTTDIFEVNTDNIEIRSTQTTISTYQRGKFGVYSNTDRFRQYDVTNDFIFNVENPITFNSTYGAVKFSGTTYTNTQYAGIVNLNYNTIKPVSTGTIGSEFIYNAITVQNVLSSGSTQTLLAGSQINTSGNVINCYRGIYSSNFATPKLITANNALTVTALPWGGTQYGINHVSCSNSTITTNNVLGPNTTSTLIDGIYAALNNTITVTCNTVSTTYQGFEFSGSNPGTIWKGNSMQNHIRGIILNYTAAIGQQGSAGNPIDNTWNGTWTSAVNYHTWTDNGTFATSSSPLWTRSVTPYIPLNNDGSPTPNSYQSCCTNTTTGSYSCGGGGGNLMAGGNGGGEESMKLLETISESVVESKSGFSASNFISQNQLFRYLKNNADSKSLSTKLSIFYTNNQTSSYGKLSDIEDDLASGNYAVAVSNINSIKPKNNIESNYLNFYTIYKKWADGSYGEADIDALKTIASKCPFTDGAIVYQARALFNIVNNTVEVFEDNCPQDNKSSSRLMNSSSNGTINNLWNAAIYPNPATDELYISTNQEKEEVKIIITDVNGRVLIDSSLKTEAFTGRIKLNMNSGIYFVTLSNTSNEKVIKKLVISN